MDDMLRLVGSAFDIKSAINDFRPSYHQDFANVQLVAGQYLNAPSGSANAALLARALSTALRNWGYADVEAQLFAPSRKSKVLSRTGGSMSAYSHLVSKALRHLASISKGIAAWQSMRHSTMLEPSTRRFWGS
jgi:hypothetical protein